MPWAFFPHLEEAPIFSSFVNTFSSLIWLRLGGSKGKTKRKEAILIIMSSLLTQKIFVLSGSPHQEIREQIVVTGMVFVNKLLLT
jgi:hypothetical protein